MLQFLFWFIYVVNLSPYSVVSSGFIFGVFSYLQILTFYSYLVRYVCLFLLAPDFLPYDLSQQLTEYFYEFLDTLTFIFLFMCVNHQSIPNITYIYFDLGFYYFLQVHIFQVGKLRTLLMIFRCTFFAACWYSFESLTIESNQEINLYICLFRLLVFKFEDVVDIL